MTWPGDRKGFVS